MLRYQASKVGWGVGVGMGGVFVCDREWGDFIGGLYGMSPRGGQGVGVWGGGCWG